MSDRLRSILDAAIAQRPKDFNSLMAAEVGQRIVDKINARYENTFIDGPGPEEEDDDEDAEWEVPEGDEDIGDLFDNNLFDEDDTIEEVAAPVMVGSKKTEPQDLPLPKNTAGKPLSKQGQLAQTRDQGTKNFINKHHVKTTADANGNDDELFNASNITPGKPHGYTDGQDEVVYEEKMTPQEIKARNKRADEMMNDPKVVADFKKRYGKGWKGVLMATVTKQVMD